MNYAGFIVIALGLLLIVIGARGSQKALLPSIFGTASTPLPTNTAAASVPTLTINPATTNKNSGTGIIPLDIIPNTNNGGMLYL